ncbi:MAG: ribosomal protein S18-alanine N-acetyltransferase [Microbacteriaceae bacterium]
MTWQMRRAAVSDLDAIMSIETPVFGSDAWPRHAMASELNSAHTYYLVAHRVDTPAVIEGYAGLLAPSGSGQGDIQTIAVAESARRTGLGRLLMLTLVAEARDRGATDVFLEVRADNPSARAMYLALGFENIAVRPQYYQPDGVDAIIMQLTIPEPLVAPTKDSASRPPRGQVVGS